MEITFKKGRSKNTLVCLRKDGTSTWTTPDQFMITHDMAHFCVETVLGITDGFYGLITTGIDISDFENKEKVNAKILPPESKITELIVGQILTERADNKLLENFNTTLRESAQALGITETKAINNETLSTIRNDLNDLLNKWALLPPENTLTLHFKEK